MNIITKDELKEVNLPFPGFKPNTLILSEQINDNNDELQYRVNLLIRSYLKHINEDIEVENLQNALREAFDNYVIYNDDRVLNLDEKVEENKIDINNRVDEEILSVNKTITTQVNSVNSKISNKGDALELKNTLLYLKSGEKTISVADLSSLGGAVGKNATYLASGHAISKDDWDFDETHQLYYVNINHSLNTSLPVVSYYDEDTNLSVFDAVERIDSNNIIVYTDVPINTYMAIIDGSGNVNIIQAILDDDDITTYRTWSSSKIRHEIDSKTVDLSPIENSIKALEDEIGVNKTTLQSNINAIREVL